jgi:GDP-L-fucose synthase
MSADKLRALGWTPNIGLREGIAATYEWFLGNIAASRADA